MQEHCINNGDNHTDLYTILRDVKVKERYKLSNLKLGSLITLFGDERREDVPGKLIPLLCNI